MFNCKLKRKMCSLNVIKGIRPKIMKIMLFYRPVIDKDLSLCVIQSKLHPRFNILSGLKDC